MNDDCWGKKKLKFFISVHSFFLKERELANLAAMDQELQQIASKIHQGQDKWAGGGGAPKRRWEEPESGLSLLFSMTFPGCAGFQEQDCIHITLHCCGDRDFDGSVLRVFPNQVNSEIIYIVSFAFQFGRSVSLCVCAFKAWWTTCFSCASPLWHW